MGVDAAALHVWGGDAGLGDAGEGLRSGGGSGEGGSRETDARRRLRVVAVQENLRENSRWVKCNSCRFLKAKGGAMLTKDRADN